MSIAVCQPEVALASPYEVQVFPEPLVQNGKILLIEDDRNTVRALWRRFHRAGYEVLIAQDGRTGLDLAMLEEVDVVLLDLGLPRMHGLKVLHELRVHVDHVPVVIITGSHDPQIEIQARAWGVAQVFHKPFSPISLVRSIQRLLWGD